MSLRQFMESIDEEATFQSQVLDLAKLYGWLAFHVYDSRRSEAGYPDLTLAKDRVIFAELKSATGKLSPEQKTWLERLRAAGAETYVWRPADLQRIATILGTRRSP